MVQAAWAIVSPGYSAGPIVGAYNRAGLDLVIEPGNLHFEASPKVLGPQYTSIKRICPKVTIPAQGYFGQPPYCGRR